MRRILFWGVIAIAFCVALVWTISFIPEDSAPVVLIGAVVIVQYASLSFLWFYLRRARKAAGALLLDCGPGPWSGKGTIIQSVLTIAAIGLLGYSLFTLWGHAGSSPGIGEFLADWGPIYGLLVPVWIWNILIDRLLLTGHLELREHGVWNYVYLVAWDNVSHYHWERDKCVLSLGERIVFSKHLPLMIPRELKDATDTIIAAYCPTEREYLLARADA